jgi:hypothetical protein
MKMKQILGAAGLAAILATASPARADHAEELAAQTLYDKALDLMRAGKPASACPLLAESQRLDPAAGTQYRLAECFEKTGRTEAAWRLYTEVAEASKKAGRKDREAQARERAEAVRKLLAGLTITIPPELMKVEGLVVTCDGKAVSREEWNLEEPVEAGEHTVEARATGKKVWRGMTTARAGAVAEMRVPLLDADAALAPVAPSAALPADTGAVEPPQRGPDKRVVIAGVALTAVGIGMGGAFLGLSFANASELDAALKTSPCPSRHGCSPAVVNAEAARSISGNASVWSFLAAGVLGSATLTYVLVPRSSKDGSATKTALAAGPGGVGVTFARSW